MSRNENSDNNILDLFIGKEQIGNGYFDQYLFNSETDTDIENLTHLSVEDLNEINQTIENKEILTEDNNSSPFINTEIYEKIMNGGNNEPSIINTEIYEKIMNGGDDEQHIYFSDIDETTSIELPEYINIVEI